MTAGRAQDDRSLGEVQAMVVKAAHGAGLGWDLSREAGWAARWLCARDVDGVGAAVAALADIPGTACPIRTGAWAMDQAARLGTLTAPDLPLRGARMLVPFAARIARLRGTPAGVLLPEGLWGTDGQVLGPPPQVGPADPGPQVAELHLGVWLTTLAPATTRARPSQTDWRSLEDLAARTYAPATEASRRLGAGADGTTDGD